MGKAAARDGFHGVPERSLGQGMQISKERNNKVKSKECCLFVKQFISNPISKIVSSRVGENDLDGIQFAAKMGGTKSHLDHFHRPSKT